MDFLETFLRSTCADRGGVLVIELLGTVSGGSLSSSALSSTCGRPEVVLAFAAGRVTAVVLWASPCGVSSLGGVSEGIPSCRIGSWSCDQFWWTSTDR